MIMNPQPTVLPLYSENKKAHTTWKCLPDSVNEGLIQYLASNMNMNAADFQSFFSVFQLIPQKPCVEVILTLMYLAYILYDLQTL